MKQSFTKWWFAVVLLGFISLLNYTPASYATQGEQQDALVGKAAPTFTLPAHTGEISLANYLGKQTVVLAFYPKDFTSG